MQKMWRILPLAMLLVGCATKEVINPQEYDATKHARLRVFDTSDNPSIHIVDCNSKEKYTRLSTTGWFNKSNRIGMTQTAETDNAQQNGGKFREYVIPAGEVLNITPSSLSYTSTCDSKGQCVMTSKQLCEYPVSPPKGIIGNVLKGIDTVEKGLDSVNYERLQMDYIVAMKNLRKEMIEHHLFHKQDTSMNISHRVVLL